MPVLKKYNSASGKWITVGGMGLPKTPISFSANKGGTNQTGIVTSTDTKITFSATTFNNGAGFSIANSRFTAPIAGVYGISLAVKIAYPIVADSIYSLKVFINGTYSKLLIQTHSSNTNDMLIAGSGFLSLNAGDYVEVYIKQFSGSDRAIGGAVEDTVFQMCLIPDSYDVSKQVIDLSSATEDYLLQVGETAVINFTSATSIPLRIRTSEGIYELELITTNTNASTSSNFLLYPNNNTGLSNITARRIEYAMGGTGVSQLQTSSAAGFIIGSYITNVASFKIITHTANKTAFGNNVTSYSSQRDYSYDCKNVWSDTTTAWTSLGTLTSGNAHTGKVIIRRIA